MLLELGTQGFWSVSRACDQCRSLQEASCRLRWVSAETILTVAATSARKRLGEFARFFLSVCIDQATFMESLVQPDRLRARITLWAQEEVRLGMLPPKSGIILEAVLYRGELPRADAAGVVGRERAACAPHRVGADEAWRAYFGHARAPLRLCLSGGAGLALDAWAVSREDSLGRYPLRRRG